MANYIETLKDFPKVHRNQLITVQDLIDFKHQLIADIKKLLKEQTGHPVEILMNLTTMFRNKQTIYSGRN